ncbi:MAG: crosslink repair DNA glycosylase YcaQ family protein [Thermomicrobiales bacterium]
MTDPAPDRAAIAEIAGGTLTRREARELAVIASRLDRRPRPSRDAGVQRARLHEMIRALGCVQLDTISVISRSHETVLWSRLGQYDPRVLNALYAGGGVLTEYWAHAAAIIPIETFPYYRGSMADYVAKYEAAGSWAEANQDLMTAIHQRFRDEGELASRHFERHEDRRPEAWEWYGGKPARQALQHLWSRGDLMVARRESGFQRVYDLTERLIPEPHFSHEPTQAERARFFTHSALRALGVTNPAWAADYFRSWARPHIRPAESQQELQRLAAENLAIPVAVDGIKGPLWMDAALASRLLDLREGRGRPTLTTLLSPFDNLIWNRQRDGQLFDIDLRIEFYTPAPKRIYGYYSLPILHKGAIAGRLDAVVDRRAHLLTVRNVHLESRTRSSASLAAAVAASLWDLAGFLQAEEVLVLASDPPEFAELLATALK